MGFINQQTKLGGPPRIERFGWGETMGGLVGLGRKIRLHKARERLGSIYIPSYSQEQMESPLGASN